MLEQKLIQYNFNQAAKTYNTYANMQKNTAAQISEYLRNSNQNENAVTLDLGSGLGTFPDKLPNTILYDISIDMLKRRVDVGKRAINGIAEQLPFLDKSFSLVISNLMIQWSTAKEQVLREVGRVLQDEGVFIVTTLVNKSLWQLESAWKELDNAQHLINFATRDDYLNLAEAVGFDVIGVKEWEYTEYFNDIETLFRSFKRTGTSLPKSTCNNGLGGREHLKKLDLIYPRVRNTLPLTYHNLLLVLKKPIGTYK